MTNKDILTGFFNEYFSKIEKTNKYSSSFSKKRNYLKKFNIFYTENNILKFTPRDINKSCRNTINIFNNFYTEQPLKNKEIIKRINRIKFKKNLTLDIKNIKNKNNRSHFVPTTHLKKNINCNFSHITNTEPNVQIRASSTYFESTNSNPLIQKVKSIYDSDNKKKEYTIRNQIDEQANKIVNYYMSTNLSNIKNNKIEDIKKDKMKDIEHNIKNKYSVDQQLLKMNNIKHQLMLGKSNNFKSGYIQLKALGNSKNIKNTLMGIKDFYLNEKHKRIKDYIIDNKKRNEECINEEILNELKFEDQKVNFAYTDRIKRNILKNRKNKNIGLLGFNKAKINKTEYLNFYQKLDLLHERVKKTYSHIEKRVQVRQKYKDNISGLFMYK
jgi:hypothetical protein